MDGGVGAALHPCVEGKNTNTDLADAKLSVVQAVYSWYVKHPATQADRKQIYRTPAAFSTQ